MDRVLRSLWCNYGYSVEKGVFCNTTSLIYIHFFRCRMCKKRSPCGWTVLWLSASNCSREHLCWCTDAGLNLKLSLPTSYLYFSAVLSIGELCWAQRSGWRTVFQTLFLICLGLCALEAQGSQSWRTEYFQVEWEGCRSLWLMGGGKLGASVLFVFVKYLQCPHWSLPC